MTPDFGSGSLPDLRALAAAMLVLPECERYQFAEAIAARARTWRVAADLRLPSPLPVVVRVEQDPLVAPLAED